MSGEEARTTEARPALATESARLLLAAFRTIEGFRRHLAGNHGIAAQDVRALSRIAEGEHVTPKALAESLELTTGSVTSLVDKLETAGLVARTPHPHDRRSLQLVLTPDGVTKVTALYAEFESHVRDAMSAIPEDQVRAANEFLAVVARTAWGRN
jgi:DNA-binding MarR family transcriptional regulator